MSTPGSSTPPKDTRPKNLLDDNIHQWTQKLRVAALKKKQEEEKAQLHNRIEALRRVMAGMPQEIEREQEQQLQNELDILLQVHKHQEQFSDVAPDVINSIYSSFLELPEEDRPSFAEYLPFKQKLNALENTIFKLAPDQFDKVLADNGGSLAVVFLNMETNPLRVLNEEREEVRHQQQEEEELEDEDEEEELEDEDEEEDLEEEDEEETEEEEDEVEDMEEEQENEEDKKNDQEDQQMMENNQQEHASDPKNHPVHHEAVEHINPKVPEEEKEKRANSIKEKIRRELPTVMGLLDE